MEPSDIGHWIERLGLPAVAVVALWIAATKILEWWAPRIERWADAWFTSNEKTQETYRNVATESLNLQRSNSVTMQGMALTITALHEKMAQQFPCPLGEMPDLDDPLEKFRQLRIQQRTSRRQTIARHKASKDHPESEPPPEQTE
jgi:hypothetical protein